MLTFQEIISCSPFYDAEIIGGWKGKDRFIFKAAEYTDNLDEPSLLLLPCSSDTLLQFEEYLSIQNVQGILIYGKEEMFISSQVIEVIESAKKPVLVLKEANPLSIKKGIADLQQIKTMGFYHYVWERSTNYWLQMVHEKGLDGLLRRMQLFLDEDVVMLNEHFYVCTFDTRLTEHRKDIQAIYFQQKNTKTEALFFLKNGQDNYLLFQLRSGGQHFGFILLKEQPGMMIDVTIEQVTHAIPAIISYLKKEEAVFQAHRSYKENFLNNLLYNNIESEQVLLTQGRQWGWDFTKPTQLMVMKTNPKTESTRVTIDLIALMRQIHSIVHAHFLNVITIPIQGKIVMIIFDSSNHSVKTRKEFMVTFAQKVQKEIQHSYPLLDCQIGLGRHYPSNMELFRSFYEAKVALELGKYESKHRQVIHFEDIGIARLLANIHNNLLHEYYQETLGELIQLDKENDDFYLETMDTFFNNNGDINQTAEQLYIHPNTLRKRLKKLENILNVDFNQLDDLLNIFVALKIMKMLQ